MWVLRQALYEQTDRQTLLYTQGPTAWWAGRGGPGEAGSRDAASCLGERGGSLEKLPSEDP